VGKGDKGDPVFDQFLRSQAAGLTNGLVQETLTADGWVALLDKIGPAILMPNSQPGAAGWLVADRRPNLVKALVRLEPGGPPVASDGPPGFETEPTFEWGLTRNPVAYSPPASNPPQLRFVALPKEPEVATCWMQANPPRQLPNLQKVPILLLTSPSGYNSWRDPCTSKFLTQARVDHTWLKLQDIGIHGNGHFGRRPQR
jgi:pimeloyl-ACP methyl ester carboxylesterase